MSASEPVSPCVEKTIALVFETFRGVNREGGVSWSETFVRDDYGNEEECREARLRDKDSSWEEVAIDPNWEPFSGNGGFAFLDPIGFRYYLPAALVQRLRGREGLISLDLVLELPSEKLRNHTLKQWSALEPIEIQCVCEFLKCIITVEKQASAKFDPYVVERWERTYRSHWVNLDANPLPE